MNVFVTFGAHPLTGEPTSWINQMRMKESINMFNNLFNQLHVAYHAQVTVEYEGSIEMGCSGMYIVIDHGVDGTEWTEVTGAMPYERAAAHAARLNKQ